MENKWMYLLVFLLGAVVAVGFMKYMPETQTPSSQETVPVVEVIDTEMVVREVVTPAPEPEEKFGVLVKDGGFETGEYWSLGWYTTRSNFAHRGDYSLYTKECGNIPECFAWQDIDGEPHMVLLWAYPEEPHLYIQFVFFEPDGKWGPSYIIKLEPTGTWQQVRVVLPKEDVKRYTRFIIGGLGTGYIDDVIVAGKPTI